MKTTYFSTFISGFSDFIEDELKKSLRNVSIKKNLDGLVVYETDSSIEDVRRLKFFNNSFVLFVESENVSLPETLIRKVLREFDFSLINIFERRKTRFRVIVSKENELIKIDNVLLRKVEDNILQNKNFILDRATPDLEFWFLVRSESLGFFGVRITRHKDYKKVLDKGELRPELVRIMVLLSNPEPNDVFLDPFAGSGAIPAVRKDTSYKKVIAYDIDPKPNRRDFLVQRNDATNLKGVGNDSIDKIVTDPPWGLFDKNVNLVDLYSGMLTEFIRVLKVGGILVVLVANKELFEDTLESYSKQLKLVKQYNILVSGKKAAVYKSIKL